MVPTLFKSISLFLSSWSSWLGLTQHEFNAELDRGYDLCVYVCGHYFQMGFREDPTLLHISCPLEWLS